MLKSKPSLFFIGIALGDTFYIRSLRILGTRKTLTVEAFSPILANLFGILIIDEILPLKVWLGAFIVSISLYFIANQNVPSILGTRGTALDYSHPTSVFSGQLYIDTAGLKRK